MDVLKEIGRFMKEDMDLGIDTQIDAIAKVMIAYDKAVVPEKREFSEKAFQSAFEEVASAEINDTLDASFWEENYEEIARRVPDRFEELAKIG